VLLLLVTEPAILTVSLEAREVFRSTRTRTPARQAVAPFDESWIECEVPRPS